MLRVLQIVTEGVTQEKNTSVAAGVFVATVAVLPSYHPAGSFVGDVRFQKSSQDHGLRNLDTSMVWRICMADSTFF
jgi:hypothetical protein